MAIFVIDSSLAVRMDIEENSGYAGHLQRVSMRSRCQAVYASFPVVIKFGCNRRCGQKYASCAKKEHFEWGYNMTIILSRSMYTTAPQTIPRLRRNCRYRRSPLHPSSYLLGCMSRVQGLPVSRFHTLLLHHNPLHS